MYFDISIVNTNYSFSVPPEALAVTATSDDATPILGQSYSMDCTGHKTASGLINKPVPQWFTPNGTLLSSSSSDVQLQGPRNVGLSSAELIANFPTLRTSHAGNYTCQVSLSSPALTSPIVKVRTFSITVKSEWLTLLMSYLNSFVYQTLTLTPINLIASAKLYLKVMICTRSYKL